MDTDKEFSSKIYISKNLSSKTKISTKLMLENFLFA